MSARVLQLYLSRRVGLQIVALLAVLTAMMQLLELLDVTTDILERGQGIGGLVYYALLRTPAEMVLALPLAVLLGAMTVLHAMARGLEIAAMRASGVSLMRMLGWFVPVMALFALLQLVLVQAVLPRTETALKQWWNASAPPDASPEPLWANTNAGPVSIDTISPDGRRLIGVHLYTRANGLLTSQLEAKEARWDHGRWQLTDVSELRLQGDRVLRIHDDTRVWQTNLHPDEVLRLGVARPYLSSIMLADVIAGTRVGSQPLTYYQTALYRSFTAPLGVFIMLLLALPTAAAMVRGGVGGGRQMLMALVLGLGFLLADGIMASLGSSGRLAPLVTALAAPLAFGAIGLLRVLACERI